MAAHRRRAEGEEIEPVRFTLNGRPREGRCPPRKLLVDFLREDLGQTGTHVGCELTALDLLCAHPDPTADEIREGISAVLCRCTGYQGIIKAVQAAAPLVRKQE